MQIRWMAVWIGLIVDFVISGVIVLLTSTMESYRSAPDLSRPDHLLLWGVLILSTGVGGFVAGRIATHDGPMHGLLVGVVGILIGQLDVLFSRVSVPQPFVIGSAIGCLAGALGGALSMLFVARQRDQE